MSGEDKNKKTKSLFQVCSPDEEKVCAFCDALLRQKYDKIRNSSMKNTRIQGERVGEGGEKEKTPD